MTDSAPPPAFMDLEEIAPKHSRRRPIHLESAVQRGVKRAVSRAVSVEHEFVCHDRGPERNEGSHIWDAQRGYRRSWPDSELVLAGGLTFRCELKKPGWSPPRAELASSAHWNSQDKMIGRLNALQHSAAWANSVTMYLEKAQNAGVPLRSNWRTIAQHEDELVASDIRRQIERRDAPPRKSKAPRAKVSAGRIRRLEGVRGRVMF